PRPDDMFALGFLARGQVIRDGKDNQELAITAVETVSTAFMALTVGCAKCHNHMYDPIKKRDFYAMKARFDPLVLKKATPASAACAAAPTRASPSGPTNPTPARSSTRATSSPAATPTAPSSITKPNPAGPSNPSTSTSATAAAKPSAIGSRHRTTPCSPASPS